MTKKKAFGLVAFYFLITFFVFQFSNPNLLNMEVHSPLYISSSGDASISLNDNQLSLNSAYLRAGEFVLQAAIFSPMLLAWYPLRGPCFGGGGDCSLTGVVVLPAFILSLIILFMAYSMIFISFSKAFGARMINPMGYRAHLASLIVIWIALISMGIWYAKGAYIDPIAAYVQFTKQLQIATGNKNLLPDNQSLSWLTLKKDKNDKILVQASIGQPRPGGANLIFGESTWFSSVQQADKICRDTFENYIDGVYNGDVRALSEVSPRAWVCSGTTISGQGPIFFVGFLGQGQNLLAYTSPGGNQSPTSSAFFDYYH